MEEVHIVSEVYFTLSEVLLAGLIGLMLGAILGFIAGKLERRRR